MKTYTIKEVSNKFNIPSSTLRYYEELGMLSKVERTSSNQRIYTEKNLNRLQAINCFKNAGMTLPQIKKFFDYEKDEFENIDNILILLQDQESSIASQLEDLKKAHNHIQRKLNFYSQVKESLNNKKVPLTWDEFNSL